MLIIQALYQKNACIAESSESGTTIIAAVVTSLLLIVLLTVTTVIVALVVWHHRRSKKCSVTRSPVRTLTHSIPNSKSFQHIVKNAQESDNEQSSQSENEENEQSNPLYNVNNSQDSEMGQQLPDGPKTDI